MCGVYSRRQREMGMHNARETIPVGSGAVQTTMVDRRAFSRSISCEYISNEYQTHTRHGANSSHTHDGLRQDAQSFSCQYKEVCTAKEENGTQKRTKRTPSWAMATHYAVLCRHKQTRATVTTTNAVPTHC